jgi:hypothetical protein
MATKYLDSAAPGVLLAAKALEWDLMVEFETALWRSRMDENEILRCAHACADGLLHFGLEDGLEESTRLVAGEVSAAIISDTKTYGPECPEIDD